MTTVFDPGAAATEATDAIFHDTLHGTARGVVAPVCRRSGPTAACDERQSLLLRLLCGVEREGGFPARIAERP